MPDPWALMMGCVRRCRSFDIGLGFCNLDSNRFRKFDSNWIPFMRFNNHLHLPEHDGLFPLATNSYLGIEGQFPSGLFAAAYRPRGLSDEGTAELDVWHQPVEVGGQLPELPLWIWDDRAVPVNLEATYARTCHDFRVPMAS